MTTECESVLLGISYPIDEMTAAANTFIQKRICSSHLGLTFWFYLQLY